MLASVAARIKTKPADVDTDHASDTVDAERCGAGCCRTLCVMGVVEQSHTYFLVVLWYIFPDCLCRSASEWCMAGDEGSRKS